MSAGKYTIKMEQGSRFDMPLLLKQPAPVPTDPAVARNITGYQLRMQVRKTYDAALPFFSFDSATPNGILISSPTTGAATLTILPAVSSLYAFDDISDAVPGVYIQIGVYDMELYVPGNPAYDERILEGKFWMKPEVTR